MNYKKCNDTTSKAIEEISKQKHHLSKEERTEDKLRKHLYDELRSGEADIN